MTCDEARELITALVDRELIEPERSALEMHFKECSHCRLALEEEQALKETIRAAGLNIRAPREFRDRILSDPRIFPEKRRSARAWWGDLWPTARVLRPALAIAMVLVLALPALYLFNQTSQPVAYAALESYALFQKGNLPVIRANSEGELKAQLTRAVDERFEPMGYDLSSMNLRPVAGAVREWAGRNVLVAIYQGEGGFLLCYTFLASDSDPPAHAARFFDAEKKMDFYAFSRGPVNAVLHREGDVTCILVSEMPMHDLLALARSKAKPH
ncbi:MAG TPA: zf-HC2 domain-containing protein [Candidatus Binatia bacterium]|nr:zf-HC2 domain-containing protein [Candidatus Binatia bacterium]